ncbi:MAG: PTS sugar transporter subunit IIA [Planctomycetes bacterium]|nr:PTS sugar transporter subunit IIA [Planctomycetota bacterium]
MREGFVRLIEIIGEKGVIPRLRATDRDEALLEIVDHMVENGHVPAEQREEILMALLKREALGATSIGNSVAIPHVKTNLVNNFVGSIGISRDGIRFAAGEPLVHIVILFLSPERAVSGHLRLLAHIGGILNHDGYVRLLRDAQGRAEIVDLIRDAERMIFGEDPGDPNERGDDSGTPVLA